jgi:hypothetical protein
MNKLQKDLEAVAKEEAKKKDAVAMETFAQTFSRDDGLRDKKELCRKLLKMIDEKYDLVWLEETRNSYRCPGAIGHRGTSPHFKGTKEEWKELAEELIWVEEKLRVELAIQDIETEDFMREVMDLLGEELEIHDNRVDQLEQNL